MGTSAKAGFPRLVDRPVLLQRLDDAVRGPVTVVAAPAGSGKSALVRSWLARGGDDDHSGWVTVERGERDEQRFWSAVVATLSAVSPIGAVVEPAPTPDYDADAVLDRLLTEIAAVDEPTVLVLDDVHEIADAGLTSRLTYFLDHLPSALHVVLISRRDLQLGLHRRRLSGELTEIRTSDLQFTLDETRQLVESRAVFLSAPRLKLLHERTEGWVTGLLLATVSLVSHPDPERFVIEFSGSERTVAEYLLAEVLSTQPDDIRRLLLRASLLDRVNGALGDLLTDSSGSEGHLQQLADDGAFVVALDSQRTWFRFHRLFSDLLAAELRLSEPEQIGRLHLAAAGWFARHDLPVEAIKHAQTGGDQQLAAELLIQYYFTLALDGRQASAHSLLEAYSVQFLSNPPEIAAVMANDELANGTLEQAAAHLALAERGADLVPDSSRHNFDVALLLTRLTLAQRLGDFRSVLAENSAVNVFIEPRMSSDIAVNNDVRLLLLMNLGIVEVWCGSFEAGTQHLMAARDAARRTGRPYVEVSCLAHWARATSAKSFADARAMCVEAIALAEQHGWGADPVIAPALSTLGISAIFAGRFEEGERWITRADRTLRGELEPAAGYLVHLCFGSLHLGRGRFDKALASFRAAQLLGLRLVSGSALLAQQRADELYAMLQTGDLDAVRLALADLTDIERDAGELRETAALLALADGRPDEAIGGLSSIVDGSAQVRHPIVLVGALLIQARAYEMRGDTKYAEACVERALDEAEHDTLILPFLLLTSRTTLETHPRSRSAHGAFLREILDAMSGGLLGPDYEPDPSQLDPLSTAEVRLLRYLPTNLTAAAVAGELFVTTNTVKTHMRHIYAKLNAHTREEAVVRARDLGLLGPSARHAEHSSRND